MRIIKTKALMAAKDRVPGGLADGKTIHDIVVHHGNDDWPSIKFESLETKIRSELKKGIEVELEHVDDKSIAEEIAMDHLMEDPAYYSNIEKCHKD